MGAKGSEYVWGYVELSATLVGEHSMWAWQWEMNHLNKYRRLFVFGDSIVELSKIS